MKFLTLLLASVLVVSCTTSPTGRKQFVALPESYMAQMGRQAFEEQKREIPVETDAKINAYVRCVAYPIINVVGPIEGVKDWDIVVFRDDQVNAFALPGGRIGVYTGLFKAAQNADQLATVMSHEVGHVLAQHGNERVSQTLVVAGGLEIVKAATSKNNKNHGLLMAALGIGAQYGVILPHGRTQESEADLIGLGLMARAGFNPQESIKLWQNMGRVSGGSPPEFLSTHPSHSTRISQLNANMADAMEKYNRRKQNGALPACQM